MKKALLALVCLAAMMMASMSLKAQQVTIPLMPGWTWISYPSMDTLDFATALGSFIPAVGDVIESQFGIAEYHDGEWFGDIQQFYPGYGYLYYSSRSMPVFLTFNAQQPVPQVVVTTSEPTDITATSVVVGGTVTLPEGSHIFLSGVCWGTDQMPTVDDNHTSDGSGTNDFTTSLMGLTSNTTYYVRAYVVTDFGLAYGEERSFTTLDYSGNVPEGAIDGLFSVSATQQVYFSKGNLQYQASTNTWRFAENQWDYVGTENSNISATYDGWIDLFGWGTSGYNHGATCYQPWSTNAHHSLYNPYGSKTTNLYDNTGQADWGYNSISNGGNTENIGWRTLCMGEWNCILFGRTTSSNVRFAKAKVNDVKGIIVVPDDWNTSYYELESTNDASADFTANIINNETWLNYLEYHGAVFLPASGWRIGNTAYVYNNNDIHGAGAYWSSSHWDIDTAYSLQLYNDETFIDHESLRYLGYSVRLVRNAE